MIFADIGIMVLIVSYAMFVTVIVRAAYWFFQPFVTAQQIEAKLLEEYAKKKNLNVQQEEGSTIKRIEKIEELLKKVKA